VSCPEIERVLAIIECPKRRETWRQVYDLCYRAVCTPSLEAPVALDILIDRMIELRQWGPSFRSVERARTDAFIYSRRRCGMFTTSEKRSNG
jgi:hypothetical protein